MANNCPKCNHKIDTNKNYDCPECGEKFWQSKNKFDESIKGMKFEDDIEEKVEDLLPKKTNKAFKKHYLIYILGLLLLLVLASYFAITYAKDMKETKQNQVILQNQIDSQNKQLQLQTQQIEGSKTELTTPPAVMQTKKTTKTVTPPPAVTPTPQPTFTVSPYIKPVLVCDKSMKQDALAQELNDYNAAIRYENSQYNIALSQASNCGSGSPRAFQSSCGTLITSVEAKHKDNLQLVEAKHKQNISNINSKCYLN